MISVIYKITFLCVFGAIVTLTVKSIIPSFVPALAVVTGLVCVSMIFPHIKSIFDLINSMSDAVSGLDECITITVKIVSISLLCEFAAQTCSDAGENFLAAKIDFAGKIIILCICAPEFLNLINTVIGLISIL